MPFVRSTAAVAFVLEENLQQLPPGKLHGFATHLFLTPQTARSQARIQF